MSQLRSKRHTGCAPFHSQLNFSAKVQSFNSKTKDAALDVLKFNLASSSRFLRKMGRRKKRRFSFFLTFLTNAVAHVFLELSFGVQQAKTPLRYGLTLHFSFAAPCQKESNSSSSLSLSSTAGTLPPCCCSIPSASSSDEEELEDSVLLNLP